MEISESIRKGGSSVIVYLDNSIFEGGEIRLDVDYREEVTLAADTCTCLSKA
jgi:hypothetical protein